MTDMMEEAHDIRDMRIALINDACDDINHLPDLSPVEAQNLAMGVDMIHHLAEAENNIRQAEYYMTAAKAMRDGKWKSKDYMMEHSDSEKDETPMEMYNRMISMLSDVWNSADMELRKKMKAELAAKVNAM